MDLEDAKVIITGATSGIGYEAANTLKQLGAEVSGLTECWRAELRPYNVRVMQINPSEVITISLVK